MSISSYSPLEIGLAERLDLPRASRRQNRKTLGRSPPHEEAKMRIAELEKAFQKRARTQTLHYEIRPAATAADLDATERRLGLTLPSALREFYGACNGLVVNATQVDIFPLDRVERQPGSPLVLFAQVYGTHKLCLDASGQNVAGQWTIVLAHDGYEITRTIGSFLANKLWGFIDSSSSDWLDTVLALRDRGPVQAQVVWAFNGRGPVPGGIFSKREAAEAWIAENRLSGTLTEYPLGYGAYDYAVRNGTFTPKGAEQVTPGFIGDFAGALNHCHYEDGSPIGAPRTESDVPGTAAQPAATPAGRSPAGAG